MRMIGERNHRWLGCDVCGISVPEHIGAATRAGTRIGHAITRLTRWHRQATAVWRLEHDRDPITGRFDPRLVVSPWAFPDADILGDIARAAQAARRPYRDPSEPEA